MTTIIKIPKVKKTKKELQKELQEFTMPNRDPDKAIEELYGMWDKRDISIEKIRQKSNRNKWLSNIFASLFQNYALSHDTGIADSLVAATALHYNLPLLSINQKHFKHIPNLILMRHNIIPLKGKSFLL